MLFSDSTHFTDFGTASLWPIYAFFGNLSKYVNACPSSLGARHLAYIPSLPDFIQDLYSSKFGEKATADVLAHLKREIMNAVWLLLLDDEFMEAYRNGIVVLCADMILRRIFPCFFSYAADYPEKVLLACIKNLGTWLCPRCFVMKPHVSNLGSPDNRSVRLRLRKDTPARHRLIKKARRLIFRFGKSISSKAVSTLLNEGSLVPTLSAFSSRLEPEGFDFYELFVVDFMHEVELGVIKQVMTHIVRMLECLGGGRVTELNRRFRSAPTFGRDIIRKFSNDVCSFKKMAARDYEDMIEIASPLVEGLFPGDHDAAIVDLLMILGIWHAYGKLRISPEEVNQSFRECCTLLSEKLHHFKNEICPHYDTKELARECQARQRRQAQKNPTSSHSTTSKVKVFTMNTYKFHSILDYPDMIEKYGTTDSYSTLSGELEHRRVKRAYKRSSKTGFQRQIARRVYRERRLQEIASNNHGTGRQRSQRGLHVDFSADEPLPLSDPAERYQMSHSRRFPVDLFALLAEKDDPALKLFLPSLKNHLLMRLNGVHLNGVEIEYSQTELDRLTFVGHRIYKHKVIRFNYTSYDLRR
ncbi:hypothetical protein DL96DRAFT_1580429, partial [Flagelloscypha sp. PMI_526]